MVGTSVNSVDSALEEYASMSKRPRSALLTQKILAEHKDLYLQVTSLNPFFSAMGNGTVPPKKLMHWVNQHRLHARVAFIKLLGHTLTKVTTMDERNFPHEQNSFDLICEAVQSMHHLSDFLGHILLELEDENDVGIADICFNESDSKHANKQDSTNEFTPENWAAVDFLLAAGADCTLPECLVIIWSLAQIYYDGWSVVKEKMIENGTFPDHEADSPPANQQSSDQALMSGIFGNGMTPQQKLASHWTSPAFASFTSKLATNVQGYVDIHMLDEKVSHKLFERTLKLESKVWPQM